MSETQYGQRPLAKGRSAVFARGLRALCSTEVYEKGSGVGGARRASCRRSDSDGLPATKSYEEPGLLEPSSR
jgi:hypothetical protein